MSGLADLWETNEVHLCGEKVGYRIWIPDQNDAVLSRGVVFKDEITFEKTSIEIFQTESTEEVCEEDASCIDSGKEAEIQDIGDLNTSLATKMYNMRNRSQLQKPSRFEGFVMLAEGNELYIFQRAINSSNRKEWSDVMQEELTSLIENETWE
ncbi:hypothetical protein AVEN_44042-1 [Araneus ventricosus]|uniref:Uncharacterized protein n=1 Tax=Araneus ventricosus TaxID=182803 RepID=A0A4Y2HAH1_ARAVE|nr:hypothetical protein AVEN_44042-1 [Araneus ventricosus]